MLDEIVPETVTAEEAFDDPPGVVLFPEEEAAVARAVDKRRREFSTVRLCARRALARLGLPPSPIVPGTRGAPGWPPGLVGSMTHCPGYRAAAVARRSEVAAIGIDAEPDGPLPEGVLEVIARPEEHDQLAALSHARPDVCAERLLFSAKESVFKAWYPLTGRELGFEDATVSFDPDATTFSARLLVDAPAVPGWEHGTLRGFCGRWVVRTGVIVTAIVAPPGPAP